MIYLRKQTLESKQSKSFVPSLTCYRAIKPQKFIELRSPKSTRVSEDFAIDTAGAHNHRFYSEDNA